MSFHGTLVGYSTGLDEDIVAFKRSDNNGPLVGSRY